MRSALRLALFVLVLSICFSVSAQTNPPTIEPERVTVTAADGLVMVGDFYRLPGDPRPAVMLLHGSTSRRQEWNHFVQPLLDAGYHVLNVDLRGHGETGGVRNLGTMIEDVQFWLDWLKAQPDVQPDALAMIGSSMGTVPALGGCAPDPACRTAVLASPGDFPLLTDAVYEQLEDRSVLFLAGRFDSVLYDTRRMFERTTGEAALHIYHSGVHGSALFLSRSPHRDSATRLVLDWLNDHL